MLTDRPCPQGKQFRVDLCQTMALRTLPIRPQPVPGESLESWLETVANRCGASWGDVLTSMGLQCQRRTTRRPYFTVWLTDVQMASVSYATGVPMPTISSMVLSSLFGVAATDSVMPKSVILPRSRFCPKCLAENGGRWQLWWQLRWAFACPVHHCLLADACPRCLRYQRVQALPDSLVPYPGQCTCPAPSTSGRSPRRCGTMLSTASTADLPESHPVLAVQRDLLRAIESGSISTGIYGAAPASALQFVADLTALGQRIMRYSCVDDLRARVPPDLWNIFAQTAPHRVGTNRSSVPRALAQDASATAAVAACIAAPILQAPTAAAGGQRLRWLVEAMRADGLRVSPAKVGWGRAVSAHLTAVQLSALKGCLGPAEQLRHRSWAARPRRAEKHDSIHRSVPAWLWSPWALQARIPPVRAAQVRSALSVALVLVGSRIDITSACASLGSIADVDNVSRVLSTASHQRDWATTASTLTDLSDALSGGLSPIDYQRRRELPIADLLPEREWLRFCSHTQTAVDDPKRARLYRWWLYERLTGSPARYSAAAATENRQFWRAFAELPAALTPQDVAALDECGRIFLDEHGMDAEPVRWHPPLDILGTPTHHNSADMNIDVPQLHRLIRVNKLSIGAAATVLGTCSDAVRETLHDHPAARRAHTATGTGIALARAELPRDLLIDLLHQERQPLWAIALRVGVTPKVMGHLAHEYRIPTPAPHRRRTAEARTDPPSSNNSTA